ncbi:MAG: hypothetical protein M3Z21_00085 [Pseudomonadota bacterium]|nr:hypothetical protein [Pseudomonadota bacterium]
MNRNRRGGFFPQDSALTATNNKLDEFQRLPIGWHYGEGKPPRTDTLQMARELHQTIINCCFSKTDAFPGIDGEVQITLYYDGRDGRDYLEFTIETGGLVNFVQELNDEEVESKVNLSLTDAQEIIENYRDRVWDSFVSSIRNTSTSGSKDSVVSRSKTPVMEVESPSFPKNASRLPAYQSADILKAIILEFTEYHLFFGESRNRWHATNAAN